MEPDSLIEVNIVLRQQQQHQVEEYLLRYPVVERDVAITLRYPPGIRSTSSFSKQSKHFLMGQSIHCSFILLLLLHSRGSVALFHPPIRMIQ